jgi:predicted Holliday junction resolvase-like endonuclease
VSTGIIVAIIVVVVIILLIAAVVFSPKGRMRRRERELDQRRDRVIDAHRTEAQTREREAAEAEKRAQLAQAEAQRQRAEAELHESRAGLHEQGLADHELVNENERDRFAGTSAVQTEPAEAQGDGDQTAVRTDRGI